MIFLKNESAGGGSEILTREQVAAADTWDLTPLYPTPEAWSEDLADLQRRYAEIAQFKGRLGESAAVLRECLEFDKTLDLQIERLNHYASLRGSEDSSDDGNLRRESMLENLLTKIGEAHAFLSPEIQAIDDAQFARYLADPVLEPWIISLKKLRRTKPHTLSEREERLLALGASALGGHHETYSQLTNVDMKFGALADEHGVERALTQSSFSSFLVQRDGAVRTRAFRQFYAEFADHKFALAASLASSVRSDVFLARARNFPSAREGALFYDDVPVSVYDNLISTVRAHLPVLHRYYELRRRVLGLEEIHQCDTYVPMVANIETRISFDEATDKVLDALEPLGDEYVGALAAGLKRGRWCDRYETKGKRSGAFSSSSYGNPPYLMMNYKDDVFAEVYTLAHEAGHSMHTWFSQRHQEYQNYDYPIFSAEVASTFNEELLTHHLLEKTGDLQMRAYLLNRQIDDIRGTVFRQTMFAEFEKIAHALEEAGEALTLDTFRAEYRKLLDAYFGPQFSIDEELSLECLRIPHFYHAFYVYKYATGMSAAVALSQRVLAGGDAERESYLGFLKSGGSKYPLPTLRDAGVDMSSPEPVARTLALFESRVAELEQLLA